MRTVRIIRNVQYMARRAESLPGTAVAVLL